LNRLQSLVRDALTGAGGQEMAVPHLPDAETPVAVVRLVRREIDSYRQLPAILFQMVSRARSEPELSAGLFQARQRPVVEIYAFGPADLSDHDVVGSTINAVLAAVEVPVLWASAGDEGWHAFFVHTAGEEKVVCCSACHYAAEQPWARTAWPEPPKEPEWPTEEIATPGCDTIASLAEFLQIPAARTLKMVFYSVEGDVTCVVIRGDRSVDEAKLARILGTDWYYASLEHELEAVGAVGGYASPIGLDTSQLRVVADPSVRSGRNFVSGANRPDYHIKNVNIPRDFVPGEWADLALVEAGDLCPSCGAALQVEPAFSLAHGAVPGPCQPVAEYLDAEGRGQPLWMAAWQLDLARLMAAIVEQHHDDYGILWPSPCAPFDVHLVTLDTRQETVATKATALYEELLAEGFSVLQDERDASAGVKFNDADLIGIPLRLTVGRRSAEQGVIEAKWRDSADRLKLDEAGLAVELARLR
jgi:prolyl-tRNA synthetase